MSWKHRYSQAKGQAGENAAVIALQTTNLEMVEEILTGWRLLKTVTHEGGKTLAWIVPQKKVAGDFRAVVPGTGQSALIEVKNWAGDKFSISQLKKHQRAKLHQHHELGGLSLVVWVADNDILILRWPIEGLALRKPLTYADAVHLDLKYTDF